jgi:hypothetical protein
MTSTYEKIASTTLGSTASTVTFSSIPATYTDLVLISNVKASGGNCYPYIRLNSDTGTNYSYTYMSGTGSSALSGRASNTAVNFMYGYSYATTANNNFNSLIQVMNYSNTTTNKTMLSRSNNAENSSDTGVGLWRNTAAVTTVTMVGNSNDFAAGSTFTLYGIKAE